MTDPTAPTPDPGPLSDPAPPPATPASTAAPVGAASSAGLVYGDVPNRIIAYILDAILIGLITFAVLAVLAGIGLATTTIDATTGDVNMNFFSGLVAALISLAISGAYFIYTWTRMRGTLGMKALGMQVGNAGDGATITTEQAVKRWLALGAVFSIAQVFNPFPLIGLVLGLAALAWVIFLLYTTAQSPTKQGWHDTFANTMVVKAARNVG